MASYVNDLRLKEIGTGESSGTWGSETNTNLELIGDALGFGTEAITTNADTHTTTVADGSADAGRAMYIKYTGALDSACTITIGPNTINRMHFIENATTGSQNIIISQGTGSNVTIPAGDVKAVYLDGAGSGAAVADAFTDLNLAGTTTVDALNVSGALTGSSTIQGTTITATTAFVPDASDGAALGTSSLEFSDLFLADAAVINLGDDQDTTLTHVADTGILLNSTRQLQFGDSGTYIHQSADGVLDLVSDTELELNATTIDINGNADISGTLGVTGAVTADAGVSIDNITIDGNEIDVSSGDLTLDVAGDIVLDADGAEIILADGGTQFANLKNSSSDFEIKSLVQDKDIKFVGNDNNSDVTALTLDMSEAGSATFNSSATFGGNIIGEDIKASGSGGLTLQTDEGTKRLVITDAGNVGVGTTSPSEMLHVTGDIRVDTDLILQSTKILYLDGGNDTYINEVAANTIGINTAGGERVRIDSSGKVGIGETSISQNLDVKTSTVNTGVLFYNTNTTSGASVPLFLASEAGGSTTNISIENAGASNMLFRTGATSKDGFGTERMRIASNGSIGMGTTPPTDTHTGWTQLFIGQKGSVISENATGVHGLDGTFVTDNMYVDSDTGAFAYIEANESSAYRQEAGIHQFFTHASGSAGAAVTLSEKMRLTSAGDLGVGTTSPQSGIHIAEGGTGSDGGSVLTLSQTGFGTIVNNDDLGSVHFGGVTSGGVGIHNAAKIMVEGDGTWASNDYPTRLTFHTTADGDSSAIERMRINNSGHLVLQEGNGIFADTGRTGDVQITGSFTNVLNFNSIGGTTAGTGFYLVTAVRTGASVGTHIVLLVGASSNSLAIIYATLASASMAAEFSNDTLRLRDTSGATINVHVTAVPIGITGND